MDVRYGDPSGNLSVAKSAPFTLDLAMTPPPLWESSKVSLLFFSAASLEPLLFFLIVFYIVFRVF